jgi:signal transduction histidine kinase
VKVLLILRGAPATGFSRRELRASTGARCPEMVKKIFEPFVQVDREGGERSQQAVGLGLAISRELAAGMGGMLDVQSTVCSAARSR